MPAAGRSFTPRYDEIVTTTAAALEALIASRLYDVSQHLIDRLVVTDLTSSDPAQTSRLIRRLAGFGYRPLDGAAAGTLTFAAPRLIDPQVDVFQDAPHRGATLARYGIQCRGVIQVGAHIGQQVSVFRELGARRLILVEANPAVYRRLQANVQGAGIDVLMANCAITDFDGETELMLASFDQSSSLLPLAHHSVEYPNIQAVGSVKVPARRLDTLVQQEFRVDPADYNVLEIDVQGAEGLVLRGATEQLRHVDAVYAEINFKPMYQGCLLIDAIDALMLDAGLIRVQMHNAYSPNWGDALYVRRPPVVSMSTLGSNGRLGNQIFQYAFLQELCRENGLRPAAPTCALNDLFELPVTSPPVNAAVRLDETSLLSTSPFSAQTALLAQGRDLIGYFQFHTSLWRDRRSAFRQAFPLNAASAALQSRIRQWLRGQGYCVAIHYRQGDFSQFASSDVFYRAPLPWYTQAVVDVWGGPGPTEPAFIYLASDSPVDPTALAATGLPVITSDALARVLMADPTPGTPRVDGITRQDGTSTAPSAADALLLDFLVLKNADALLISNSTFSFAAALLNDNGRVFLRPRLSAQRLVPFDPWHSEVLLGLDHDAVRFGGAHKGNVLSNV